MSNDEGDVPPPPASATVTAKAAALLTTDAARSLLATVDFILFDIDGVIWSGDHIFTGVPQTFEYLRRDLGKQLRFVTNNSMRTRGATKDLFHDRGMLFVQEEMLYTSAYVAALQLKELWKSHREGETHVNTSFISDSSNPFNPAVGTMEEADLRRQQSIERLESDRFPHNVFVIGERGLHAEIRDVALAPTATTFGFELVPDPTAEVESVMHHYVPGRMIRCLHEPVLPVSNRTLGSADATVSIAEMDVGAVVVGFDSAMNNVKLAAACLCLQLGDRKVAAHARANPDAAAAGYTKHVHFIATNEDPQLPFGPEGYLLPGAGTCVAAVATAIGRRPDLVCGKPELPMAHALLATEGITDPSRCLMVGDRLSTDIAFGNAMGAKTMFVLTGVEGVKDVEAAPDAWRPDFIATSAADLDLREVK